MKYQLVILVCIISLSCQRNNSEFLPITIFVDKQWANNCSVLEKGWTKYLDGNVEIYDLAWGYNPLANRKPTAVMTEGIESEVLLKGTNKISILVERVGAYEGIFKIEMVPQISGLNTLTFASDGKCYFNGIELEYSKY